MAALGRSNNFAFLAAHDQRLADLAALAERYFADDPATTLFKLRQFGELLAKLLAPAQPGSNQVTRASQMFYAA